MKLKMNHQFTTGMLLLAMASASHAALISYTDRTTWESMGSVAFTENFESFISDTSFLFAPLDVGPFTLQNVGTPVTTTGINFVDVTRFDTTGVPASFGNAIASIFVQGSFATDIIFDSPVQGFFADFLYAGNTTQLNLTVSYLGGGTDNVLVPGPGTGLEAFGFMSTADAITSIRFSNTINDGFVIDNISAAAASVVPVPAAAWLFGSGIIGLIGIARRKTA